MYVQNQSGLKGIMYKSKLNKNWKFSTISSFKMVYYITLWFYIYTIITRILTPEIGILEM